MKHTEIINGPKIMKVKALKAITMGAVALAALVATSANAALAPIFTETEFVATLVGETLAIEDFDAINPDPLLTTPIGPSVDFPAYNISATSGELYAVYLQAGGVQPALSVLEASSGIVITFNNPQRAVGGLFFNTDEFGSFVSGTVIVSLTDGTTEEVSSLAYGEGFLGFTSPGGASIMSLTVLSSDGLGNYVTVDHLMNLEGTGVSPVPEPTTLLAGLLLVLPFGMTALRTIRKNRAAS